MSNATLVVAAGAFNAVQIVKDPEYPSRLVIPALGIDSPVQYVGVNAKGEMDVPSGKSGNVGWYRNGTLPGNTGSAVIAAHVYAVFSKLKYLIPGQDIYVTTRDGSNLHFRISEARTYRLEQLPPEFLFNRKDDQRLNLITCAGKFIPALDTYDQRLVVYANLVDGEAS